MVAFGTPPADWKEWRRIRALELYRENWMQVDIAKALGVSQAAVSQWISLADEGGADALRSRTGHGRPSRLAPAQMSQIPELLWHGAEAYGFRGDVWTCGRIAEVLRKELGVAYHPGHVSRLLKQLGWTPQLPITRAIQRNEVAIREWRLKIWPMLKTQARKERRTLVFTDESGFYLLPGIVKTYAPSGATPILRELQTRDHLSVMGALTHNGYRVYTMVRHKSLNGLNMIEFLQHLLRVAASRLLVVWDGSPIHRRTAVQDFVAGQKGKVRLEQLPGYAPDLNPVEWLWQHLKHVELRNLVTRDLEELHFEFHLAVGRIRYKRRLIQSFFHDALFDGTSL
jgi:transposase